MLDLLLTWLKQLERYIPAIVVGLFSGFCRYMQGDVYDSDSERSILQRFLKQLTASLFAAIFSWLVTAPMPISGEVRIAIAMVFSWSAIRVLGYLDEKMSERIIRRIERSVMGKESEKDNDGDE